MTFRIAIVGRPNVGKSRLFNRLTRGTGAIVHDEPGVTRDRIYGEGTYDDVAFEVIDTGGITETSDDTILERMRHQTDIAFDEADVVLFMMDGREGLVKGDHQIAERLRKAEKPVVFVVNKADERNKQHEYLADFYELGVELHPISAEHAIGIDGMMSAVFEAVGVTRPEPSYDEEDEFEFDDDSASDEEDDSEEELSGTDKPARCAVVGKPNAGKSTLVNAMLGEDRLITSEVPGTTRDAVDTHVIRGDDEYLLIDTAGMRKKSNVEEGLERASVVQAIRSIDRSDVAVLVIDGPMGITNQDKKIADVIESRGRGCVLVINKWDQIESRSDTGDLYNDYLSRELPWLDWAPRLVTSALTGRGVHKVLDAVDIAFTSYNRRIDTSTLNDFLQEVTARHSPPQEGGRAVKLYYMTQVAVRPPRFIFFGNRPDAVARSYRRFLENELREAFDFRGTPLRLMFRDRSGDDE